MQTATPHHVEAPPEKSKVQTQARRLLDIAGSPELAKHALNAAAAAASPTGLADDQFATRWGFISYLALTESSTPVGTLGGRNWCLTSIGPEHWILWNNTDFQALECSSREDAERQFRELEPTTSTGELP